MPDIGQKVIGVQLSEFAGDGSVRPGSPGVGDTGVGGVTQDAILAEFARRLANVEGRLIQKVDGDKVLSMIALAKEAVLIQSDKVGLLGEVTIADWQRDISGVATGQVAPSITQIRGGVIRTERVQNFAGTAWVDLDAVGSVDFLHCGSEVSVKANGTFSFGSIATSKALQWDGANLTIGGNTLLSSTSVSTVVANANFGATRSVGDITASVLANSATSITMTSSQLFKTTNGVGGVFIGAGGIIGKNSSGATTFAIDGASGSAVFAGDIQTNGKGIFNGVTTISGFSAAIHANSSFGSQNGVLGFANGVSQTGIHGWGTGSANGVVGETSGLAGNGIYGSSINGATAVRCEATDNVLGSGSSGSVALNVVGVMRINNTLQVPNLNSSFVRGFGGQILTLLGSTTSSGAIVGYINVQTIDGAIGKLPLMS
jgi:hypothetical protein